tara:strand:- start:74 stop:484 length:411 start_codon:yes stop_codon:yes gene_type:complete
MKEKNIWKTIRLNSNIVKWDRIESKTSPGIPDLHGFFKDIDTGFGHTFWVELKLTKTNKVLLSSKQIAWHHRFEKYGGTSFICVKALLRRSLLIYVGKRFEARPRSGHDRNMVRGSLCAARQNTPRIRQTVRLYID